MHQDATWYGGRPRPTRHCVRCGPSYRKRHTHRHPIFGPCLLWPNGWMDDDAAWYGSRPRPSHIVLDGTGSQLSRKVHSSPVFSAHVYCGHGRPSQQLLLRSCFNMESRLKPPARRSLAAAVELRSQSGITPGPVRLSILLAH